MQKIGELTGNWKTVNLVVAVRGGRLSVCLSVCLSVRLSVCLHDNGIAYECLAYI